MLLLPVGVPDGSVYVWGASETQRVSTTCFTTVADLRKNLTRRADCSTDPPIIPCHFTLFPLLPFPPYPQPFSSHSHHPLHLITANESGGAAEPGRQTRVCMGDAAAVNRLVFSFSPLTYLRKISLQTTSSPVHARA